MAIMIIDDKHLTDIANAIRDKSESTTTYKPREMAAAISSLFLADAATPVFDVYTYSSGEVMYNGVIGSENLNATGPTNEVRYIIDTSKYNTDVTLTFTFDFTLGVNSSDNHYDRVGAIYWTKDPTFQTIYADSTKLTNGAPYEKITNLKRTWIQSNIYDNVTANTKSITIPASANSIAICFCMYDMPEWGETGYNNIVPYGGFKVYNMRIEGV